MKKKELDASGQDYRCSNPLCGRTFEAPLKTTDLSQPNREPYESCPCCLREITEETALSESLDEHCQTTESQPANIEEPKPNTVTGCTHHLGYLCERSAKETMPEECITCTQILNCMLKTVKNTET
jgi:hypothetical protein